MCRSMADIQSPTAEIRRGKKKERRTNHSMKIYMVSLFHRATIKRVTSALVFIFNIVIITFLRHLNKYFSTFESQLSKTLTDNMHCFVNFCNMVPEVPLPAVCRPRANASFWPRHRCIFTTARRVRVVRYHNDMFKCLYDGLKTACDAVASYIFTTYQVTTWNRSLAAMNCSVSKY